MAQRLHRLASLMEMIRLDPINTVASLHYSLIAVVLDALFWDHVINFLFLALVLSAEESLDSTLRNNGFVAIFLLRMMLVWSLVGYQQLFLLFHLLAIGARSTVILNSCRLFYQRCIRWLTVKYLCLLVERQAVQLRWSLQLLLVMQLLITGLWDRKRVEVRCERSLHPCPYLPLLLLSARMIGRRMALLCWSFQVRYC